MKLILKQDVKNLGYKDELVTVKNGYGNNFLIPRGYGVVATKSNLKVLAENVKQAQYKTEKIQKDADVIVEKLKDTSYKIGAKTGTSGKIFGAVTTLQLAQAIKTATGLDVDRRKIVFDSEIKHIGTYTATINIIKNVAVQVGVEVVAE